MNYQGKSKSLQEDKNKDLLQMTFTDHITAGNGEKADSLLGKGAVTAAISHLLYKYLAKHGIETHMVAELDAVTVLVKKAEIIPIEIIVRNIAAGSFSKKYGVAEGTELIHPSVEFSVKSDALGDPMINKSQITAIGLAKEEDLDRMIALSLEINQLLSAAFAQAGISLIDYKLEFGLVESNVILCDEISPDSCRLWDIETKEKLDKDRFRRDLGGVVEAYDTVLKRLQAVL